MPLVTGAKTKEISPHYRSRKNSKPKQFFLIRFQISTFIESKGSFRHKMFSNQISGCFYPYSGTTNKTQFKKKIFSYLLLRNIRSSTGMKSTI